MLKLNKMHEKFLVECRKQAGVEVEDNLVPLDYYKLKIDEEKITLQCTKKRCKFRFRFSYERNTCKEPCRIQQMNYQIWHSYPIH